jgi:hypothetical protein
MFNSVIKARFEFTTDKYYENKCDSENIADYFNYTYTSKRNIIS